MTIEEVRQLKAGDVVRHKDPQYPALGVVMDARLCSKGVAKDGTIKLQYIGGGCQVSTVEYNGWANMELVPSQDIYSYLSK